MVDKQPLKLMTLPELEGAVPPVPSDLHRLHRLCLHIYGLLTRDIDQQAQTIAQEAGHFLKKKQRILLQETLADELPVIIALHVLERLDSDERLRGGGLGELLPGMLLPFFALSYRQLYDQPTDPLKYVLARVDWYLDGGQDDSVAALIHFLHTAMGEPLRDTAPLTGHLKEVFLPEMDQRLELAFRYEFSQGVV